MKSARTPAFIVDQLAPPSSVPNTPTADIPTHIRSVSVGSSTMLCRHMPPKPGSHKALVGCSERGTTSSHVSPPSELLNSAAGETPA